MPDTLVVAPVLAADVRHQIRALREAGRLREVVGGLGYHAEGPVGHLLSRFGGRWYRASEARRVVDEVPSEAYRPTPWPELASRVAVAARLRHAGPLATDAVFAGIDRRAAKRLDPAVRVVLGREDGCLRTFRAATGVETLYDLPIPHHRHLNAAIDAEGVEFPQAGVGSESSLGSDSRRTVRKDAELAVAGHILVASRYVRDGLQAVGISAERVTTIPYGCDIGRSFRPFADRQPVVLYVGHLSLRKGVPRLLRVWKKLGAYRTHTLRLIGKKLLTDKFLAGYAGLYEHLPPMPRSELWSHFSTASAFVFPSACDGFGLVLNEALSCGTPIIASSNTGAPGFITEGVEGLTYTHGEDDALAAHLERLLSRPSEAAEMGRAAYALAQRWGWPQYRAAFRELVERLAPSVPVG